MLPDSLPCMGLLAEFQETSPETCQRKTSRIPSNYSSRRVHECGRGNKTAKSLVSSTQCPVPTCVLACT